MNDLLRKEFKLAASRLSFWFVLFGFMTLLPGYPILCGAFFITLGILYSFQAYRESNDILFSTLLPVSKSDVVKGKFAFCVIVEAAGFAIMVVLTLLRMTVFVDAVPYTSNALMNANLVSLGFALLVFGLFNFVFISGFFKTAYYYGKPFILSCVTSFIVIIAAETLHHIPGFEALNAFGFAHVPMQLIVLVVGLAFFVVLTVLSLRKSIRRFQMIDL